MPSGCRIACGGPAFWETHFFSCQGFGPFGALAVRGPGVPDRGEMEEEKEKEEEEKWADLRLKSNNPTLNGGE